MLPRNARYRTRRGHRRRRLVALADRVRALRAARRTGNAWRGAGHGRPRRARQRPRARRERGTPHPDDHRSRRAADAGGDDLRRGPPLPAALRCRPDRDRSRARQFDGAAAQARTAYVLGRMVGDNWITRSQADAAEAERIEILPASLPPIAHQFVAFVRAELARLRPDLARRQGLVIETTLDAGLQSESERLVRLRLAALRDRNATDAALVAIEPGTGRIVAWVGSATDGDPAHGGEIDMARTPRQPGSALKPLLYAAAFQRGYTAATPLPDVPPTFATDDGPYAPANFDRTFHGVVPLRVALASSLNVPAVRTLDAIGLDSMLEITHRFGLTLDDVESYGLSLTLGSGEVRLVDLTNAYAAIGAAGQLAEPFAVARVRDGSGRALYERAPATTRRVLSPEHAYLLSDILSDPDARIPGFGGVTPFDVPFPAPVT